MLYFDLHTYSGILASDDAIRLIKVRYGENETVFDNSEEKIILQEFSDYVNDKDPDVIVCLGDYDNGKYSGIYTTEQRRLDLIYG